MDTQFDSLSQEEETKKQMCKEIIIIFKQDTHTKKNDNTITWVMEKSIWKKCLINKNDINTKLASKKCHIEPAAAETCRNEDVRPHGPRAQEKKSTGAMQGNLDNIKDKNTNREIRTTMITPGSLETKRENNKNNNITNTTTKILNKHNRKIQ